MKKILFIVFCIVLLILSAACQTANKGAHSPTENGNSKNNSSDKIYTELKINEVMPSNKASLQDADGSFSDWLEIVNSGSQSVLLSDYYISDDIKNTKKYRMPEKELKPGEIMLLFASDKDDIIGDEFHMPFALSKDGETVMITHECGTTIDTFEYKNAGSDVSILPDGTYTQYITPGFPNDDQGYAEYQKKCIPAEGLIINEVMTANSQYLPTNGKYYDWVELYNNSDRTLQLSEYALTDDASAPAKYVLPKIELGAHEFYIVLCDKTVNDNQNIPLSGFGLNGTEERIYLTDLSRVCDFVSVMNVPYGSSYGRTSEGWAYLTTPTPNGQNGNGVLTVAKMPAASQKAGIYNNIKQLSIELSGEGAVYYTTDGSEPTEKSTRYTEPITVDKTTVIRARSFCDGKLTSRIMTASYIINEQHTLPVLSLTTPKENLFDPEIGIYVKGNHENYYQDWERAANLTLFENGETVFSSDCGLKMFGAGSRAECEKKSMRVNFKSKYGASNIECDLFSNGVTKYKSLVLRAGEDAPISIFRNELCTSLAADTNLLVQSQKYCVLYVNGEYFGIFSLCERFSEYYYAQHFNVSEDSVTVLDAPISYDSYVGKLMRYVQEHDMRSSESYDYINERLDLNSMIDWFVFQAYTSNNDLAGNLRYIYSSEQGKVQFAFYDLDWAFYRSTYFDIINSGEQYSILLYNMLKNEKFRTQFVKRTGELLNTVLTDSNVLAKIAEYHDLLQPEVKRERLRWKGNNGTATYESWEKSVSSLRGYITGKNMKEEMIKSLGKNIALTSSEANIIRNG